MPIPKPSNRVAVVTGASRGIGQAVAIEFASRGYHVLLHAKSNLQGLADTLERIVLIQSYNAELRAMVSDLRCQVSARQLVDGAFQWKGHVDVWVQAAGADVLTGDAKQWSFEQKLRALWETDIEANLPLSRLVAHRMACQSNQPSLPSIIHLGWDQAEVGMEGDSGQYFSAVKAAVASFSKSLAKTMGPKVRVNCVAPGWIQTEWGLSAPEGWQQRAIGESILGRWGNPTDVARVIGSICCDCEFINAQTIPVNGGWQSMLLSARSVNSLDDPK